LLARRKGVVEKLRRKKGKKGSAGKGILSSTGKTKGPKKCGMGIGELTEF